MARITCTHPPNTAALKHYFSRRYGNRIHISALKGPRARRRRKANIRYQLCEVRIHDINFTVVDFGNFVFYFGFAYFLLRNAGNNKLILVSPKFTAR